MTNTPSIKDLTLVKKIDIINTREQIQDDIISFIGSERGRLATGQDWRVDEYRKDVLCQIVVNNFKKLED